MSQSSSKQNYMQGAIVLLIAGIVVKVVGALFKIPLTNLIGGQGMAYFTTAYDIYVWMYIITTAGLPVAISRMVSESNAQGRYKNARRILSIAFGSFLVLGLLGSAFLFIGAGSLARAFSNPSSVYAIMAIAPAILFEITMSAYRGFFQGNKDMVPTAVSQVIVAVVKLLGGFVIAWYILSLDLPQEVRLPYAAAGAIFGVTLGTMFGALYLIVKKAFFKPQLVHEAPPDDRVEGRGVLFRRLLAITIPIAIGSSVLSVTNLLDMGLLMDRLLAAGITQADAEMLYGSYSSLARTMFNLPTALIIPIGTSVIPVISEKYSIGRIGEAKGIVDSALRVAILLALPSGFGLALLSKPILNLLFSARPAEVEIAAPLLTALGPAVLFVCLVSITNAMLQAIGRERVPVFTMLAGGAVKLVSNLVLVGNPAININGAPIGTNLCYGVITLLNVIVLVRAIGPMSHLFDATVKPLLASLVSCGGAAVLCSFLSRHISPHLATVAAVGFAVVFYFVLLIVTKALRGEDIRLLPKGDKIEKMLAKRGWIR
ncbi:putative polysaccharide biosynthesis protein [Feifania hominis]|uniref:Polysaccharide biosynthesis protein n=1 Tax=Feifania hominis TaxID=2763660 RepID=A0A926DEQ1_9FIRM|nr:polysaccharide biosynthesis protein [Feifania hominis]MBC8536758.1 polysaccharide biosynthesis protein [Feifania hominis]